MADTKTLVIERVFDAPLEKVWKAWTEPEQIKQWWGPKDFTAPSAEIDLRVGGKYTYAMQGPPGSEWENVMHSGGEFKEVLLMKKIVSTDYFADSAGNKINPKDAGMPGEWPDEMLITVTFEDLGGKTKLKIVHEGHPADIASDAEQGWNQSLDKFAKVIE